MVGLLSAKILDLTLFIRASIDLIRMDVALRRTGFRLIVMNLEANAVTKDTNLTPRDIRCAQRYGRRIMNAARYSLPRVQCLHRSLVLHKWLREQGLPSELRIGVRKDRDELQAHAWVEMAGVILNDSPSALRQFTPLPSQVLSDTELLRSSTKVGNTLCR